MWEIGMAEERESIPTFSGGSSDALSLGFRIIVYKRQDGDRFGCDLRQSLVMPLNELLRHNLIPEAVGRPEGAGEPEATAPRFGGQAVVGPEGVAPLCCRFGGWRQPCPWL